jgi:hypothetical protein
MAGRCNARTDPAAFEAAFAPILPPRLSLVRAVALLPEREGLRLEVRAKAATGSAILACEGIWEARVVTQGAALARLKGKLGQGTLALVYDSDRLWLNRLSLSAHEEFPNRPGKPPLPAPKSRYFCGLIDPPGPFADIVAFHEFLRSVAHYPVDDLTIAPLRRKMESYIAERKRHAH